MSFDKLSWLKSIPKMSILKNVFQEILSSKNPIAKVRKSSM
jgi:hypothetical protein